MRARNQEGSVVLDKRIRTWNFFWWDDGKRRSKKIGTVAEYPTKASAWRAARMLRNAVESQVKISEVSASTVRTLVEEYRREKMPKRVDTRRSYEVWLKNYILAKWGDCDLSAMQARPIELWLQSLELSAKSKVHIRGLVRILWDFSMWRGETPTQRNPMELVTIKGATKRTRKPRSLTVEEFRKFIQYLNEPFRTMALVCVCFGLRISECLALRWSDVDWLDRMLRLERGIVCQNVDDVKTEESNKKMPIDESRSLIPAPLPFKPFSVREARARRR